MLRRQVVSLLFEPGLDANAVALTVDTLSFLFLGLAAHSLVIVFARAFYSGHDTRTPVITAVLDMVVCVTVGVATVGSLGLSGIALGLAAGAWAEAASLGILLWRRTPGAGLEGILQPLVVFIGGAILAGLATLLVVRLTDPIIGDTPGKIALIFQIIAAGGAGAATYALYTRALRIPELGQSIDLVRSMVGRGGGGDGSSAPPE